jgi:hypothetical protein
MNYDLFNREDWLQKIDGLAIDEVDDNITLSHAIDFVDDVTFISEIRKPYVCSSLTSMTRGKQRVEERHSSYDH